MTAFMLDKRLQPQYFMIYFRVLHALRAFNVETAEVSNRNSCELATGISDSARFLQNIRTGAVSERH